MTEADNSGQRLLLAAIKLGATKIAKDIATEVHAEAVGQYNAACSEYAQIMEGQ